MNTFLSFFSLYDLDSYINSSGTKEVLFIGEFQNFSTPSLSTLKLQQGPTHKLEQALLHISTSYFPLWTYQGLPY